MSRRALIYVFVDHHQGLKRLQQKVFGLRKLVHIQQSSSVYKRILSRDGKEQIEAVVLVSSEDPVDLLMLAQEIKQQDSILLLVEEELRIDPKLPLPHPILLLDAFVLKMAAECAPYWEHGVKKETLTALADQNFVDESVEFLTQGKALINVLA